jgi:hypothetical protein
MAFAQERALTETPDAGAAGAAPERRGAQLAVLLGVVAVELLWLAVLAYLVWLLVALF